MNRFEVTWIDHNQLKIVGTIDEHFVFDDHVAKFKDKVVIDLQGVERINSCGVREWVKSIIKTDAEIHYINCSSIVVSQFSMIPEFLGKNGVVDSFEAQFICEDCGHETSHVLVVGKDIEAGQDVYAEGPKIQCTECGCPMECDHSPELYFSFLTEIA